MVNSFDPVFSSTFQSLLLSVVGSRVTNYYQSLRDFLEGISLLVPEKIRFKSFMFSSSIVIIIKIYDT